MIDELNDIGLPVMASTLEALYRSPDFLNKDRLTLIADMIGPEYEEKISKRINNRLKAANLQGSPEDINLCLDTTERKYLPDGIIQVLSSMDFVDEGFNICVLGASDAGKSYLAKALGIKACNDYRVGYYHCEELLEEMSALKLKDYDKFRSRLKSMMNLDLVILDDFLLHTITEEREIKVLFDLLEKRNEKKKSTIICSQRDPDNWAPMIMNDVISANSILKRATKHYTVIIEHTDKS